MAPDGPVVGGGRAEDGVRGPPQLVQQLLHLLALGGGGRGLGRTWVI